MTEPNTEQHSRRLFIAIEMPRRVSQVIPMVKSVISAAPQDIRWVLAKNLHLTLSFLGNVSEDRIPELIQTVKSGIRQDSFNVKISGTGSFPDSRHPKVLWLGIDQGKFELAQLQGSLDPKMMPFKASPKKDHFKPHITIARIKSRISADALRLNDFLSVEYEPIRFTVNQVELVQSELLQTGAKYTVLEHFMLRQDKQ